MSTFRIVPEIDHLRDEAKRFHGSTNAVRRALLGRIEELEQQLNSDVKERASLKAALQTYEAELGKSREALRFAEGGSRPSAMAKHHRLDAAVARLSGAELGEGCSLRR